MVILIKYKLLGLVELHSFFFDANAGEQSIKPRNSNGSARDNAIDLGKGSHRFKDIYLGGGLYVGGTGTANKLDDYEEGDWTPTINSGTMTIVQAHYTKIGNRCFIDFALANFSDTSSSTDIIITGLPFTQVSGKISVGSAYGERTDVSKPQIELSDGSMRFRAGFGVSNFDTPLQYSNINNGADLAINGSIVYRTT